VSLHAAQPLEIAPPESESVQRQPDPDFDRDPMPLAQAVRAHGNEPKPRLACDHARHIKTMAEDGLLRTLRCAECGRVWREVRS